MKCGEMRFTFLQLNKYYMISLVRILATKSESHSAKNIIYNYIHVSSLHFELVASTIQVTCSNLISLVRFLKEKLHDIFLLMSIKLDADKYNSCTCY